MSAARWPHLKELLDEALRRSGSERAAFLEAACGADTELRRELESLAAASDDAGAFLEAPIALTASGTARLITSFDSGAPPAALSHASDRFPPGALINGRYRTECLVGAGGMGSVYRVSDTVLSRTLALKTMRGREHVLNLFKIEFRTLSQLGHPHLAQSYDFEPIAGSTDYFFTMEFVDGCNLFDATEGVGWPGIVDLLVQLCRVLAYVHNRGIVHRDIKPTNVLVRADGVLKLVDFGLVGMPDGADHLIGTPAYVAPELMNQGAGDYRSDLYSLGVLAYQLLCRRLPFAGLALPDLVYQQAHSLPRFPDDVEAPVWLRNVILRLCATLPSDRFRNANQVIEAINTDGGLQYPIETAVTRESYVLSGRFVGRQHELATLSAWSGQRLDGGVSADGPFMLVGGPSGVGKSRLIRELRHAVQLDRQTFVEANCFEGAAAEYGAFAEAVAQLVPLAESRGGAALVDRDWHALVKIAPELDLHRAVPPAVPLLTQEAERRRLLDTVAGFLVEVSDRCPYVLYLNDLQWAPQGTTDILRHLHRRIAIDERRGHRVRMGMLGSYRDDEIEGRPVEGLFEEIRATATFLRLNPLAAPPMRQLIQSMFGLDDIPESFVGRVLEEAAGSPFFLEEIVRVLVENGSVFVEGGVWQTTTAVGALEIPASIAATLLRRLAMLFNADQHALLRVLAAYKKPMSMSVLATAAGIGADRTQEALRALTIRHMVAPMDGGSAYRTAHDGLRTIVYDDLGSAAPAVHGRIAHALESANVRPPLSELAHHYWLASDSERALTYAQLAGEAALAVYANDEAIEHLEHALTLLASGSVEARVRVMEQLADAHFLAGHYDRTKALLLEVSQSVTAALDRARIQRKLGEVIGYSEGKPGLAVDVLWTAARQLGARRPRTPAAYLAHTIGALVMHLVQRLARHLPAATDDLQRARRTELASIYLRIGYLSFFGDPRLLFLPVFRAANVSHQLGESREHSQVHAMVAVACAGLRQRARAIRYGEEAIAEAERTRSPWHVANARNLHGVVLIESGHWRQALAYAEQAREGFTACGDHFQLAISLYTILEVLHGCGDLQVAIARGREELMVYERLGLQMIGKGVYTVFGQLLAKAGDADGITVGREVLARAEHGSDKLSTAWAHIALGDALLQFDHVDEAIDQLERGLAIRDKHRFDMYVVAPGSALLARAYSTKLRSGSPASPAVVRAFERQVARAQAAGKRFPPMRSLALLARGLLWRSRGQPMVAADDFTRAATAAERLGARLWQADAYLERGLALFEARGRSSADAERALERAAELFRACCATAGERRTTHAQREIALTGQTRIMPRN